MIYFGYTWLSKVYNNLGYDYLENKIGQFTFFVFTMVFVYRTLTFFNHEKYFRAFLIFAFIFIIFFYYKTGVFLLPGIMVVIFSSLYMMLKKYL